MAILEFTPKGIYCPQADVYIDPWLPGDGTRVVLPTRFILPNAPREGVVINLASKRLFWYVPADEDGRLAVMTFPIGIGLQGTATPTGETTITQKVKDPTWFVPAAIRKEYAAEGNPLPAQVPPGPENPLGNYAMLLGMPSYLIHGTNRPAGVGMRVSHGCVRLFPAMSVVSVLICLVLVVLQSLSEFIDLTFPLITNNTNKVRIVFKYNKQA